MTPSWAPLFAWVNRQTSEAALARCYWATLAYFDPSPERACLLASVEQRLEVVKGRHG